MPIEIVYVTADAKQTMLVPSRITNLPNIGDLLRRIYIKGYG